MFPCCFDMYMHSCFAHKACGAGPRPKEEASQRLALSDAGPRHAPVLVKHYHFCDWYALYKTHIINQVNSKFRNEWEYYYAPQKLIACHLRKRMYFIQWEYRKASIRSVFIGHVYFTSQTSSTFQARVNLIYTKSDSPRPLLTRIIASNEQNARGRLMAKPAEYSFLTKAFYIKGDVSRCAYTPSPLS